MASRQVDFVVRISKEVLFPTKFGPDRPKVSPGRRQNREGSPDVVGSWAPLYWEPIKFSFDNITFFQVRTRNTS